MKFQTDTNSSDAETKQGRYAGFIENGVLFGSDDTLFLAGGAHSVMEIATGKKSISDLNVMTFESNIAERAAWAKENDAGYVHLIFPDKQSIVPERWPLGDPVMPGTIFVGRASSPAPVLYPVSLLSAQSDKTVSLVDTHVTNYGSILVTGQIVEYFLGTSQREMVNRLLATVTADQEMYGDLGSKLCPPVMKRQLFSNLPLPGRWLHNDLPGGNNGLIDLRFSNSAKYEKRLVIFGDSFARDLARFFQFWFREVLFFRSGFFDPDLASLCRPDFVLTENVERYLDNCYSDSDRPNFFMYPHFKGSAYAPSAEFAEAFSAMLSVPRRPYITFAGAEFGIREPAPIPKSLAMIVEPIKLAAETFSKSIIAMNPISLKFSDAASSEGDVIEDVRIVSRNTPEFFDNLSGLHIDLQRPAEQDIHGSFLVRRNEVLLFGPNIQVYGASCWSCESRAFGEQFFKMVGSTAYQTAFPGSKPEIQFTVSGVTLDFRSAVEQIEQLDEPLFIATPLEPTNWGRWISTVIPKVDGFMKYGSNRKFLCYADLPWQRLLLNYLGLPSDRLVNHDPGKTYFCRDLMSIEYNVTNMTVSKQELAVYSGLRARARRRLLDGHTTIQPWDRIFVSRRSSSLKHPNYRALQNESVLIENIEKLGFRVIEPETLGFDDQIIAFGTAKVIVALGGAAIYNAVFCTPGTVFITIESSKEFLSPHCELLSSLSLRYGVIVGQQDRLDPTTIHKRWSIDVEAVCRRIMNFIN